MRLFGQLDGTIDRHDRTLFWCANIFDLPLAGLPTETNWVNYITITTGGAVVAIAWRPRNTFTMDRTGH